MRVLLDECIPKGLKAALMDCEALTVQDAGWTGKANGELLRLAEASFDAFVTLDRQMLSQ